MRTGRRGVLVFVHNIPSPYRVHLFDCIEMACADREIAFRVEFMAEGHEERRYWGTPKEAFGFRSRFWRDMGPRIRGKRWHWNPELVRELCSERPEILVVGGAWDSITGAVLTGLSPCGTLVSWLEGNSRDPGRVDGALGVIKRRLLRGVDVCAVPGRNGAEYVAALTAGCGNQHVVLLPNVVDERKFGARETSDRDPLRRKVGLPSGRRLAIWPARMIPEKGILEFLSSVEEKDFFGGGVFIVGDGPLRASVDAKIRERRLTGTVFTLGSVSYAAMPAMYGSADLFLLPSIRDQNPLSVVEAMHSGLPILISSLAGNAWEAVPTPENGWSVNPYDGVAMRKAVQAAFSVDDATLARMGARSREIASAFWNSARVAARFVDSLFAEGAPHQA